MTPSNASTGCQNPQPSEGSRISDSQGAACTSRRGLANHATGRNGPPMKRRSFSNHHAGRQQRFPEPRSRSHSTRHAVDHVGRIQRSCRSGIATPPARTARLPIPMTKAQRTNDTSKLRWRTAAWESASLYWSSMCRNCLDPRRPQRCGRPGVTSPSATGCSTPNRSEQFWEPPWTRSSSRGHAPFPCIHT